MRVIIDIDPASSAVSSSPAAATASGPVADAVDGGAAADSLAAAPGQASGGTDAGGPPQWLLDSVGNAIAAAESGVAAGEGNDARNAGPGPA